MDAQETFDKVCHHLLTQKKRAHDQETASCVYRSKEGLSCAIGCLIPDIEYCQNLEGKNFTELLSFDSCSPELYKILKSLCVTNVYSEALGTKLQNVHDIKDPTNWNESLIYLAIEYNLNPSVPMAYGLELNKEK